MARFDDVEAVRKFIKRNNEITKHVIEGMARLFVVTRDTLSTIRGFLFETHRTHGADRLLSSILSADEKLLFELGKMEGRRQALIWLEMEATKSKFQE